ncbi:MAG: FAD-dependent oxidoreductase, partial [Tenericutes bacterium]|nr:FAD-dependent oxidoreductase [Mycoplasmatota bacterium]
GEEILVTTPKGKFILEENFDAVFIAGGIGITPIRSILLSKERNNLKRHDVLIYSELEKCYPFSDELKKLPNLEIQYAADIKPTQKLIIDNAEKFNNTVFYYISGSPGFVNAISGLLKEHGVEQSHIRFDVFTGY